MDQQQNLFSKDEFQAFKKTLPGYVEFWSGLAEEGIRILGK